MHIDLIFIIKKIKHMKMIPRTILEFVFLFYYTNQNWVRTLNLKKAFSVNECT